MPLAFILLIGAMPISACRDLPPNRTEHARMARAMDKMEEEQTQSDIARAVADASAETEAAKSRTVGISPENQAREN